MPTCNGQADFTVADDQQELVDDKTGGLNGGLNGGLIELTDRQKQILELIRNSNKITIKKIAEQLQINSTAVDKHIDALKRKGAINRVGGTRGHWQVNFPIND